MVFVKSINNTSLMPCSARKARLLLSSNKAIIIDYKNFTIKLNYNTTNFCQTTTIAVDTGAKFLGIILRNGNNILLARQVKLRTDISSLLTTRRILRRARRNKLRYRQPRFLNRTKSKQSGWLPPSIQSRVNNTINMIDNLISKLPVYKLIIEVGNFDVQKMKNPAINGKEYQQGEMAGFNEIKEFVLTRDNYTCKHKQCDHTDKKLQVHHIQFRSNGGSDKPDNLITLCKTCHSNLHSGLIDDKFKKVANYKEPPFMNSLKTRLQKHYINATFCFGYQTKTTRQEMQLPKSHINDAIAISCYQNKISNLKYLEVNEYVIQVRIKKRSLHEQTARKGYKTKNTTQKRNNKNVNQVNEYKIGSTVRFGCKFGYISGFTGKSAYIKDINDNYITEDNKSYKQISLKKLNLICYNNGWVKFNHNSSLHLAKPDVGDFL